MEEDFDVVCGSAYVCSDPFRIWYYKRVMCPLKMPHEWASCPFAHQSEIAKRRDPRRHNCSLCQNMLKCVQDRECPKGDECPYAHTVFEQWLHPKKYRTMMCNMGASCSRRLCFFAHNPQELRLDTNQPQASEPYELTYKAVLQQMHSFNQLMYTGHIPSSKMNNSKLMNGCADEAQSDCKLQQQQQQQQRQQQSPAVDVDVTEGIKCDTAAVAKPPAAGPEPDSVQQTTGATALQPPFKPIYMWQPAPPAAATGMVATGTATASSAWTPQPIYFIPNAQAATASRSPQPVLMGPMLPAMAVAPPPPPAVAGRAAPPPPLQHVYYGPTAAPAVKGYGMPSGQMAAVGACRGCVMPFGMLFAVPVPPGAAAMYSSSHATLPKSADAAKQQHLSAADVSVDWACTRHSADSVNSAGAAAEATEGTAVAAAAGVGDDVNTNVSSSVWSSNSVDRNPVDDLSSSSRPACTACEECRNSSRMDGTLRNVMTELDVTKARALKLESVATAAASKMTRAALDALAAVKVAAAVKHVTAEAAATYDYGTHQQQAHTAAAQAMMHGPESEECAAVMLVIDSNGNAEDIDAGVAAVYKCDSAVGAAAVHKTAAVTALEISSAVSAVANGAEAMIGAATASGLSLRSRTNPTQSGKQDAAAGCVCNANAGCSAEDHAGALSKLSVCAVALVSQQQQRQQHAAVRMNVVMQQLCLLQPRQPLAAMMKSGRAHDNQKQSPVTMI